VLTGVVPRKQHFLRVSNFEGGRVFLRDRAMNHGAYTPNLRPQFGFVIHIIMAALAALLL